MKDKVKIPPCGETSCEVVAELRQQLSEAKERIEKLERYIVTDCVHCPLQHDGCPFDWENLTPPEPTDERCLELMWARVEAYNG